MAWRLPERGPLSAEQRRDLPAYIKKLVEEWGCPQSAVAKQIGLSGPVVSAVLAGSYAGDTDAVLRKLNIWAETEARRREAAKRSAPRGELVRCHVVEQFIKAAELIAVEPGIALLYGPSGIGKTACCEHLRDTLPHVVLVTITEGDTTFQAFRAKLARAIELKGYRPRAGHVSLTIDERILDHLRGTHWILVVDEAHRLMMRARRFLRDIVDKSGVGLLLVGTVELRDLVTADCKPDFGQFSSRITLCVNLAEGKNMYAGGDRLYTMDHIRRLFNNRLVRLLPDAEREIDRQINALGFGSVRRCLTLVRYARRVAVKARDLDANSQVAIGAADLRAAEELLATSSDVMPTLPAARAPVAATA